MTDAHTPFRQREYVRYATHRTNAAVLGMLAVAAFAVGMAISTQGFVMDGSDLATMEMQPRYFYGIGVSVLGGLLAPSALKQWRRARYVRRSAEARRAAEVEVLAMFAGVVLKTLLKIRDTAEERDVE